MNLCPHACMHANVNQDQTEEGTLNRRRITKCLPTEEGVMAGLLSLVTILHQAGEESYLASKDGVKASKPGAKCDSESESDEACPQCLTSGLPPTRENYPSHKCSRYVSCQIGVHSGSIHVSRALFDNKPHNHDTTMLGLPLHCEESPKLDDGLSGGHAGDGENGATGSRGGKVCTCLHIPSASFNLMII